MTRVSSRNFANVLNVMATSLLIIVFGCLLLAQPARAENGQGLQISPVLVETSADPGQTIAVPIKIKNVTAGALIIKSLANDFKAKGEEGDPNIILDPNEVGTFSLRHWIQPVADMRLESQEMRTLSVQIKIPKNAEPGGHYGVIRFSGVPPELKDTGVALSASVGTLTLLKVSGNIHESAALEEFYAASAGKKSGFFEAGPISFVERVKNSGNIHIKPTGTVDIKDMFGKSIASLQVNQPPKNVLPESIRRFDQELNKKWLFGRYSANLALTYGSADQKLTSQLVFWVIPWKLILAILFLITVIILVLRSSIKRYNRHIINKAQKISSSENK